MNKCKNCQRYDECAGFALRGIIQQPCEQYAPKSQATEEIHTYPKMDEVIKDLLRRSDEPMNRYILARIEELEKWVEQLSSGKKSGWISVEDRLPESPGGEWICEVVIACEEGGNVSPMIYERTRRGGTRGKKIERWKYIWGKVAGVKVTHWMPLPEPPKGDSKE